MDRTEIATRLLQARVTATSRELTRLPCDEEKGAVEVADRLLAELARTAPKASEGEATIALTVEALAALMWRGAMADERTLGDFDAADASTRRTYVKVARRIIAAGKP